MLTGLQADESLADGLKAPRLREGGTLLVGVRLLVRLARGATDEATDTGEAGNLSVDLLARRATRDAGALAGVVRLSDELLERDVRQAQCHHAGPRGRAVLEHFADGALGEPGDPTAVLRLQPLPRVLRKPLNPLLLRCEVVALLVGPAD